MRTRVSRHMLKIMVDMRCGAWFQLRGFLAAYTPILHLLTFPLSSPPALSPSMTFPPVCDCNFPARFCTIARGTLIQKRHHRFVRATFFHDIPSFPRLLCRHHFILSNCSISTPWRGLFSELVRVSRIFGCGSSHQYVSVLSVQMEALTRVFNPAPPPLFPIPTPLNAPQKQKQTHTTVTHRNFGRTNTH